MSPLDIPIGIALIVFATAALAAGFIHAARTR